jgi:hypothetical protein
MSLQLTFKTHAFFACVNRKWQPDVSCTFMNELLFDNNVKGSGIFKRMALLHLRNKAEKKDELYAKILICHNSFLAANLELSSC